MRFSMRMELSPWPRSGWVLVGLEKQLKSGEEGWEEKYPEELGDISGEEDGGEREGGVVRESLVLYWELLERGSRLLITCLSAGLVSL